MMQLCYEGSVKRVYRDTVDPEVSYFAFTDDYSVFDWGKMPDQIAGKGLALTLIGGALFQQVAQPETWQNLLENAALSGFQPNFLRALSESSVYQTYQDAGMPTHFMGWVSAEGDMWTLPGLTAPIIAQPAPLLKVRTAAIPQVTPMSVNGQVLYHYPPPQETKLRLIPLEVVFRFGMPAGSSLAERLEAIPDYAHTLGLEAVPQAGERFPLPVIEFFTKREPKDRFLPYQEALLISGLTPAGFERLVISAQLLALWLFRVCADQGITLWDGKFEFGAQTDETIVLLDSIGPDELRLTVDDVQLSKEILRQFYRGSAWEKAVQEAKRLAKMSGQENWQGICRDQLGQTPQTLTRTQRQWAEDLYAHLANRFLGGDYLPTSMTFDALVQALDRQNVQEVAV